MDQSANRSRLSLGLNQRIRQGSKVAVLVLLLGSMMTGVQAVTSAQLNSMDNHEWAFGFGAANTIAFGNDQGYDAMKVTVTDNTQIYSAIKVNGFFYPEDWSGITAVKVWVYIESASDGKELQLSVQKGDGSEITKPISSGIPANSWVEITLGTDFSAATAVSQVMLVANYVASGDIIYYRDMRLVIGGVDHPWDAMNGPSYNWNPITTSDYNMWNTSGQRNEPISNSVTADGSAGALYLPWSADRSADSEAKVESGSLQGITDLSSYNEIRFKVYSDSTAVPVKMGFWDGTNFASSPEFQVSSAGQWEEESFTPPSGVDMSSLVNISFHANTSSLAGQSGNVYIDSVQFFTIPATFTFTPTPSFTMTPTPTISATFTPSPTNSPSSTHTPVFSPTTTPTVTPTVTMSPTGTPTPTASVTFTTTPKGPFSFDVRMERNSFNPALGQVLHIIIELPEHEPLQVTVYNRLGLKIKELANITVDPGPISLSWDGKDQGGKVVASGVYMIYINSASQQSKKLVAIIK